MTARTALSGRVASFLGVGAIATLLQYCILVLSVEVMGLKPVVGSSIGFAFSAVLNYWLNYHFTFQSRNSHVGAASRFALVALAGMALNMGAMIVLGRVSWLPYVAAQVMATVLVLVWNFVGNSIWTFAHRGEPK